MLEDMVWDDKIIVGYGEDSSDSESDSEGEGGVDEELEDKINNSYTINTSVSTEEALVLKQLVSDLQKMKQEAEAEAETLTPLHTTPVGPETVDDEEEDNDVSRAETRTSTQQVRKLTISPEAVSVSHSKDATVQITGQMMQEWIQYKYDPKTSSSSSSSTTTSTTCDENENERTDTTQTLR